MGERRCAIAVFYSRINRGLPADEGLEIQIEYTRLEAEP
jgi:hypothetical protein